MQYELSAELPARKVARITPTFRRREYRGAGARP